jgi:ADP-ribose pyrophosphatase YjhB (NUDIX family)
MSRRINVRGIIVKDGKLFAVRHRWLDGSGKEFWCTPGGGLEDGETIHDGIQREMIEETGVEPVIGRILWVYQFRKPAEAPYPEKECLEFFFHIENADDYESVDLTKTTHGTQELIETGFIDPKSVNFKPVSMQNLDLDELLTKNSPVVTSEL